MSIDSGFYKRERNAGNDTFQVRESERKSNNPYTSFRDTKISEEKYEEAILKLEYYQNHYEELTKDVPVEQLCQLTNEIQRLKLQIEMYEVEQQTQQFRGRKF